MPGVQGCKTRGKRAQKMLHTETLEEIEVLKPKHKVLLDE